MTIDTATQFFMNNIGSVYWRKLKGIPFVEYYYAEDGCYVFRHTSGFMFSKGKSPIDAFRNYAKGE